MQNIARAVFDFSLDDKKHFEFLFETEGNLKLLWQFVYLSFIDQELLMLELRYKQHSEDFNVINNLQTKTGCHKVTLEPRASILWIQCWNSDLQRYQRFLLRESKIWMHNFNETSTRPDLRIMEWHIMHWDANANKNMIFSWTQLLGKIY